MPELIAHDLKTTGSKVLKELIKSKPSPRPEVQIVLNFGLSTRGFYHWVVPSGILRKT
jgi:hypothetical protein